MKVEQLSANDFEEAMDFMNMVFGAHRPTDFTTLLPALYQPTDELMSCNWAIRESERIVAIVGSYPLEWQVLKSRLSLAGIGGVSSHPRKRGKGYMKVLMSHCIDEMRKNGVHASWLGGQRQRYGYFGYEKCGTTYQFSLNKSNLRHVFGESKSDVSFRKLKQRDYTHLKAIANLHSTNSIRRLRPSDRLYDILRSWNNVPYIAIGPDGRMIGYLVASSNESSIVELTGVSEGNPDLEIARAWTEQKSNGNVLFELPPWHGLLESLGNIAESYSIHSSGNWLILDWASTLDALIKSRSSVTKLTEGRIVIEIISQGRFALQVDSRGAICEQCDDDPEISVNAKTAHRLFFGPLPPETIFTDFDAVSLLSQWCPLPLSWTRQDAV